MKGFALSPLQRRHWKNVSDQRTPYASIKFAVSGAIDEASFTEALRETLNHYDILKASLHHSPRSQYPLLVINQSAGLMREKIPALGYQTTFVFNAPFDNVVDTLTTYIHLQPDNERTCVTLEVPLMVCDSASLVLMKDQLLKKYNAIRKKGDFSFPESIPYLSFSSWQNELVKEDEVLKEREFWGSKLFDFAVSPSFRKSPYHDTESKPAANAVFKEIRIDSPGATEYNIAAAFAVLIARYNNYRNITIGHHVGFRDFDQLKATVGPLGTYMPLMPAISGSKQFAEFARQYEHDHQEGLARKESLLCTVETTAEKETYHHVDLNILFEYIRKEDTFIDDIILDLKGDNPGIKLFVLHTANTLNCWLQFNENAVSGYLADKLLECFENVLGQVISDPEIKLEKIRLWSPESESQFVNTINLPNKGFDTDGRNVHEVFSSRASRYPNHPAINSSRIITYHELECITNKLANFLLQAGGEEKGLVGVLTSNNESFIVAALASIKSGNAYVPVDYQNPPERIEAILKGVDIILIDREASEKAALINGRKVVIDDIIEGDEYNDILRSNVRKPDDTVYVIHTSGTTGSPKGVAISDKALLNYTSWFSDQFNVGQKDSSLLLSSTAFDLGYTSLWGTLLNGGCIHVIDKNIVYDQRALIQYILENKITFLKTTPSFYNLVCSSQDFLNLKSSDLRLLLLGGEKINAQDVRRSYEVIESIRIINHYGPTETTIGCITHEIDPAEIPQYINQPVIGRPIANTRAYIMDKNFAIQPPGAEGEIFIGGSGLMKGYVSGKTFKNNFIADPNFPGGFVYKTGDCGEWTPVGEIFFKGRLDNQIKHHGYRIDPAEITEAILKILPAQNIEIVQRTADHVSSIIAYIVTSQTIDSQELIDKLTTVLPAYMVPSYFVKLDAFPLNRNNKIDKSLLPDPLSMGEVRQVLKPTNQTEELLADAWAKILQKQDIGVEDDFFQIGGDSIKAILISNLLHEKNIAVTVLDIFRQPTVRQLAKVVDDKKMIQANGPKTLLSSYSPTPRMLQFFEHSGFEAHYNQCIYYRSQEGFKQEAVESVFKVLVEHHDSLRMICKKVGSEIQLSISDFDTLPISIYDFTQHSQPYQDLTQRVSSLQHDLDLEIGPLFRIGIFKMKDGEYLMLSIHHLAVDGISWRIIKEDIEILFDQYTNGNKFELPSKTDSFGSWTEELRQTANEKIFLSQKEFWKKTLTEIESAHRVIPDNKEGQKVVGNDSRDQVSLSAELTSKLFGDANHAFVTKPHELLLACIGLAFKDVFGVSQLPVDMEGHGRENIFEDININRTVGWFTTIYPVVLNLSDPSIATVIRKIKTQVREVPLNGVGFGVLKYFTDKSLVNDLAFGEGPQVLFNFLGTQSPSESESESEISRILSGERIGADVIRAHDFIISASTINNQLSISVSYAKGRYFSKTIEQLKLALQYRIDNIVNHCIQVRNPILSLSDILYKDLSWEMLDKICNQYEVEDIYPLTPMQEGILFHSLFDERSDVYFVQITFMLEGDIDAGLVERSLQQLMLRHDILRTNFIHQGVSQPLQIVQRNLKAGFRYTDLATESVDESTVRLNQLKEEDRSEPFKLDVDPLMRVWLVKTGNKKYALIWSHHHIIMDGWCLRILNQEFFEIYQSLSANRTPSLPKVSLFKEYLHWLLSQDYTATRNFWSKYLQGTESTMGLSQLLPSLRDRSGYHTCIREIVLDKPMTRKIATVASELKVTVNRLAQAVWGFILSRYYNRDEAVFGEVVSGRPSHLQRMGASVGLFINTLPHRVHVNPNDSIHSFIRRVQDDSIEKEEHQYFPLYEVQKLVPMQRSLFDHIFIFQNYPTISSIPGSQLDSAEGENSADFEETSVSSYERTNYDLNVVIKLKDTMLIKMAFNQNAIAIDAIERLLREFKFVITQFIGDVNRPLSDVTVHTPEDHEVVMQYANGPIVDFNCNRLIHQLIEQNAGKHPEAIAIVNNGRKITYEVANKAANHVAQYLADHHSISAKDIVGICMPRSAEAIYCMLGILKAGAAYLPIDPAYPKERISVLVTEGRARLIIAEKTDSYNFSTPVISYADIIKAGGNNGFGNLPAANAAEDNAYLIFTSGTTGKPKGVAISHRSLLNTLLWRKDFYGFSESMVTLLFSSFSFDSSVNDIFSTLINGGTLVIPVEEQLENPVKLIALMKENQVTNANFVPSFYRQLMALNSGTGYQLKVLTLAGERLTADLVNAHFKSFTDVMIVNEYGPTENSICSAALKITGPVTTNPSIGTPISNTRAYILDDNFHPTGPGMVGELYLAGKGLCKGYWNTDEQTQLRFIPDPFVSGETMYKTGDLARWIENGEIYFVGRQDSQVKINGIRVELSEIEDHLLKSEDVFEVAVVAKVKDHNAFLVAYCVAKPGVNSDHLRSHLKTVLPYSIIPQHFVFLNEIPLTPNKKIDYKNLPELIINQGADTREAVSPIEALLLGIYKKVLNLNTVSIHDNFFELGGDSIKTIQIIARLYQEGYDCRARDVFEYPTIGQLADRVTTIDNFDQQGLVEGQVPLSPIQKDFFGWSLIHPNQFNQSVILKFSSELIPDLLERSFRKLVEHHDALRIGLSFSSGSPEQFNRRTLSDFEIVHVNLKSKENWEENFMDHIGQQQENFTLEDGVLLKVVLYDLPHEQQLFILAHHLIIDRVSWGIILEDLNTLYQQSLLGQALVLPSKTTSFQSWVKKLMSYTQTDSYKKDCVYWSAFCADARVIKPLVTSHVPCLMSEMKTLSFSLNANETSVLMTKAFKSSGNRMNEVLLLGLGVAVRRVLDRDKIIISFEGHGREDLFNDINVSRTVGWFTSEYPVIVEASGEIGELLQKNRNALQDAQRYGISYGLFKYDQKYEAMSSEIQCDIQFNYSGQLNTNAEDKRIGLGQGFKGYSVNQIEKSRYSLQVSGVVLNGELKIGISYNGQALNESLVGELVAAYKEALLEVKKHLESNKDQGDFVVEPTNAENSVYDPSPAQLGILFHLLASDDPGLFINLISFRIMGEVRPDLIDRAMEKIIERHDVLRTNFIYDNESNVKLVFHKQRAISHTYHDLRSLSKEEQGDRIREIQFQASKEPFDISKDILLRVILIKLEDDVYEFILCKHHIIMDGWSASIFSNEFLRIYSGLVRNSNPVLPATISYRNYLNWIQRKNVSRARLFWENYLMDYERKEILPTENKSELQQPNIAELKIELDDQSSNALRSLAKTNNTTLNTVMQTLWATFLHKYTGHKDVVFGSVISGRPYDIQGIQTMIGLFINTIPVRVKIADTTFLQLLKDVNVTNLESIESQYLPLVEINKCCEGSGDLFNHILLFQNYLSGQSVELELGQESREKLPFKIAASESEHKNNYDLSLAILPFDRIVLRWDYNEAKYPDSVIRDIALRVTLLIKQVIGNPTIRISEVSLITGEERNRFSYRDRLSETHALNDRMAHGLFEIQVIDNPDKIFVITDQRKLTYQEVNDKANCLAMTLRKQYDIKPNDHVLLCVDQSDSIMIGMLGILKSGGAYLPVDQELPLKRIDQIMEQMSIRAVVCNQSTAQKLIKYEERIIVLENLNAEPNQSNLKNVNTEEDVAYTIFTSGSTGTPKAVMIRHKSLVNYAEWGKRTFSSDSVETASFLSSYAFDLCLTSIWFSIIHGGALYIPDKETVYNTELLINRLKHHAVKFLKITPSHFSLFVKNAEPEEIADLHLKLILLGGEMLNFNHIRSFHQANPSVDIWNHYGPTETTIGAIATPIIESGHYGLPREVQRLGKPITNMRAYVLDENMQFVPPGVVGELCLGGEGLSSGYAHDRELTAEKFVKPSSVDEIIYRTGDVAYWTEDWNIVFLGRSDRQVKVSGYRVDLKEIEKCMEEFGPIKRALVTTIRRNELDHLVAYVVFEEVVGEDEIKEHLGRSLPSYMIPHQYVALDAFPLNSNGKINVKMLPVPGQSEPAVKFEAPRTENESILIEIFEEVLNVKTIGIDDNFFKLGGHSIFAIRIVALVNKKFSVTLSVIDVFKYPTVRLLGEKIDAFSWLLQSRQESKDDVTEMNRIEI